MGFIFLQRLINNFNTTKKINVQLFFAQSKELYSRTEKNKSRAEEKKQKRDEW
jgi:hypothetical protein